MISLKSVIQIIAQFFNKIQRKFYYKKQVQTIIHYCNTRIKVKKAALISFIGHKRWMSQDYSIKNVSNLRDM